jgi:transcriptional regulator with XRE-family HTH domain
VPPPIRAMDIRRRVGANVKAAREAKGWSQEELADRARMHRTYVSGIERGIRNPTITVLERVGKALGIAPGNLLNDA